MYIAQTYDFWVQAANFYKAVVEPLMGYPIWNVN